MQHCHVCALIVLIDLIPFGTVAAKLRQAHL
jgi:hypothetical protein